MEGREGVGALQSNGWVRYYAFVVSRGTGKGEEEASLIRTSAPERPAMANTPTNHTRVTRPHQR